jgi:hypothetical protein
MTFGQILTKPSVTSVRVLEPATQYGTQGRHSSADPNNLHVFETAPSQNDLSRVMRFSRTRQNHEAGRSPSWPSTNARW